MHSRHLDLYELLRMSGNALAANKWTRVPSNPSMARVSLPRAEVKLLQAELLLRFRN